MYEEIISVRDSFLLWVWFLKLNIKETKDVGKRMYKKCPTTKKLTH